MGNQIIISISREYGSEGHTIAKQIAKDMGLPFYNRNMLDEIAKEKGFDPAAFAGVDEKPRNKLLSRRVKGYSNATEDNLAQMQFEFLRKKAASGESFVVLGRCSETILKEYDSLVSIFVTGNKDRKLKHVMEKFSLSETYYTNYICLNCVNIVNNLFIFSKISHTCIQVFCIQVFFCLFSQV